MLRGFRIAPAARTQLLSLQVDSSGTRFVPTLFWAHSLTIKPNGEFKASTEEVFGVGQYRRAGVEELDVTVEVDGVEFIITSSHYDRLTGKVLDFKNGKFVLEDDCEPRVRE
ncbi:MAG: hypothetical protein ACREP9_09830 [Candidatus Dormibacteraceae bacterium]